MYSLSLIISATLLQAAGPEQAVVIEVPGAELHGSLIAPGDADTLVILTAGSGPTDREGNQPGMTNNALKMLAEALAKEGAASLRYDKRGVGASSTELPEAELRLRHFTDDLTAWVRWAESDGRFADVWLLGHSEGALISLIVAGESEVAGVLSLAGSGRPLGVLLREQTAGRLPGELGQQFETILSELETGRPVPEVPPPLMSLFRPSVQPYLIDWLAVDPAELAAKLDSPLLIVQGDTDLQVGAADARALAAANPDATLVMVTGMNHVLKPVDGDLAAQMQSYADPDLPLHQDLVPTIVRFIE